MSILYKSPRIGKNGKVFNLYKFRTLKMGDDKKGQFAQQGEYIKFGKFLRKTKIDELPQIVNWLKGDVSLIGPRAEEQRTIEVIPQKTREILLSIKPGLTSLASLYFYDEEEILKKVRDPYWLYWKHIKPNKILLDIFYINNRDALLNTWIFYKTLLLVIKSVFKK